MTELAEHEAAEIERLRAENETLLAFARDIMKAWPEGGIDGFELQDVATAHGLLVSELRHDYCGEDCDCAEYYTRAGMADGVTCYRRGPLLSYTPLPPPPGAAEAAAR